MLRLLVLFLSRFMVLILDIQARPLFHGSPIHPLSRRRGFRIQLYLSGLHVQLGVLDVLF